MIYRLIFLAILLLFSLGMLLRWWHGLRVLQQGLTVQVRCHLAKWPKSLDASGVIRNEGNATDFAKIFYDEMLADWQQTRDESYRRWERTQKFATIIPPLVTVLCVLALIGMKLHWLICLAVPMGFLALSVIMIWLVLPLQMMRVMEYAKKIIASELFPDESDQKWVIACLRAHVWQQALPQLLQFFQR